MTKADSVMSLLDEILDVLPVVAPDRLLTTVLEEVERSGQRRWRAGTLPTWVRSSPRVYRALAGLAVASLALTMAVVAFVPLGGPVGPAATSTVSPSGAAATPSPLSSRSSQPPNTVAIDDPAVLLPGTVYTSRVFEPWITFEVVCRQPVTLASPCPSGPEGTEFCGADTSFRSITLGHAKSCNQRIRVLRPWAIDCGTPDAHPDATTLAAALVARPGMPARDIGNVGGAADIPPNLLAEPYAGRVVEIFGTGRQSDTPDPGAGHCWILPEPRTSDRLIDIRPTDQTVMVLLDVRGELIVLEFTDGW